MLPLRSAETPTAALPLLPPGRELPLYHCITECRVTTPPLAVCLISDLSERRRVALGGDTGYPSLSPRVPPTPINTLGHLPAPWPRMPRTLRARARTRSARTPHFAALRGTV